MKRKKKKGQQQQQREATRRKTKSTHKSRKTLSVLLPDLIQFRCCGRFSCCCFFFSFEFIETIRLILLSSQTGCACKKSEMVKCAFQCKCDERTSARAHAFSFLFQFLVRSYNRRVLVRVNYVYGSVALHVYCDCVALVGAHYSLSLRMSDVYNMRMYCVCRAAVHYTYIYINFISRSFW